LKYGNAPHGTVIRLFILVTALFMTTPVFAETGIDHLLGLDLAYSLTGALNHGWGIGLSYEEKITRFLSVKGTFGHMAFLTGIEDMYCASVHISLFANYYPFGNGLDKLYIGLGNGCDFMNYFGGEEVPPDAEDVLISFTPRTGWKFFAGNRIMLDISAGYKLVIADASHYHEVKKYTGAGPQFGLGFKIFFKKKEECHDG
jgi:hypothetical protein